MADWWKNGVLSVSEEIKDEQFFAYSYVQGLVPVNFQSAKLVWSVHCDNWRNGKMLFK